MRTELKREIKTKVIMRRGTPLFDWFGRWESYETKAFLLIYLLAFTCKANGSESYFGQGYFANVGVGIFSSSSLSCEISEWIVLKKPLSILGSPAQEPWTGIDQGIYFDRNKSVGYLDLKFAIIGPYGTALGLGLGSQFNAIENPYLQNQLWISYPTIITPSLSIKFVYENWIPKSEIGISIKVPIIFHGLGH